MVKLDSGVRPPPRLGSPAWFRSASIKVLHRRLNPSSYAGIAATRWSNLHTVDLCDMLPPAGPCLGVPLAIVKPACGGLLQALRIRLPESTAGVLGIEGFLVRAVLSEPLPAPPRGSHLRCQRWVSFIGQPPHLRAKSTMVRRSVTATCLQPARGSHSMNRFRVPLRWYS